MRFGALMKGVSLMQFVGKSETFQQYYYQPYIIFKSMRKFIVIVVHTISYFIGWCLFSLRL